MVVNCLFLLLGLNSQQTSFKLSILLEIMQNLHEFVKHLEKKISFNISP